MWSTWYAYYFNGYYCTRCSYTGDFIYSQIYCSLPGTCWAFPAYYCTSAFPASVCSCIDPFYDYSWDPIGMCCCQCCRACCSSIGTYCSCNASCGGWGNQHFYCCIWNCWCYHDRSNETTTWTALGSAGYGCASPGAAGGGGAGSWNGDAVRCLTSYDMAGACGLVVLHY